ncbi:hypothetical protein EV11_1228 [Prochlorococcus sp. SS52]|nr:hypothetical protein EV11_1228 [Prochlorococcus sp. SS52]
MYEIVKGLYLREIKKHFSTCNEMRFSVLFMYIYKEISQQNLDSIISLLHSSDLLATITVVGFNTLAAIFGVITFIQVTHFVYYGFDANDPSN